MVAQVRLMPPGAHAKLEKMALRWWLIANGHQTNDQMNREPSCGWPERKKVDIRLRIHGPNSARDRPP